MYYLYYNGENVQKRFARRFIEYICRDRLDERDVDWHNSTRTNLKLNTRRGLELLLNCNRRAFWPDGTAFKCKQHRRRRRRRSSDWCKNIVDFNVVEDDDEINENNLINNMAQMSC